MDLILAIGIVMEASIFIPVVYMGLQFAGYLRNSSPSIHGANACLAGHDHSYRPENFDRCEYCGGELREAAARKGRCEHCYAPVRKELRPLWCPWGSGSTGSGTFYDQTPEELR